MQFPYYNDSEQSEPIYVVHSGVVSNESVLWVGFI